MNAYIVAGARTAIGKAGRGGFRFTRPDDLGAHAIKALLAQVPRFDATRVDDLIVGNAIPEGEQGLNFARYIGLMALPVTVPGMTINRYCASGLEAIAIAATKIHAGLQHAVIAGGAETMSMVPMGGYKQAPNYDIAVQHSDYYWGMGMTAEAVAKEYNVSREDSDHFAYTSHQRAIAAIESGKFTGEIAPMEIEEVYVENDQKTSRKFTVAMDEGPRKDTSVEALAKLKPAFAANGVVTAGNSSQTSDGAGFVLVVSEQMLKEFNLTPIARLVGYSVQGVEPRIMGIGPIASIPDALKKAGLKKEDLDVIELNEAFATQSLAILRTLELDPAKVNPNGGAIALGHPLGATGGILSVKLFHELKRRGGKYGMVTACVGGGQGISGIYEML